MSRFARLSAALVLSVAAVSAGAQQDAPPKIGYVSLERIIRESTAAKAAQDRIQQEFSRRDKDLQDIYNKALKEALDDGSVSKYSQQWFKIDITK